MKRAPQGPQIDKAPAEGIEAFKKFYDAEQLIDILDSFKQVCEHAKIEKGGRYVEFFPYLKAAYMVNTNKADFCLKLRFVYFLLSCCVAKCKECKIFALQLFEI